MGAYMRSNDAVFGFCNDVYTFCLFQQLMLNELNLRMANLELGEYCHYAGSFHVYERHFKMLNHLEKKYETHGNVGILAEYEFGITDKESLIKLKPHINLSFIKENNLYLPSEDLTKEQIIEFSRKTAEVIFE